MSTVVVWVLIVTASVNNGGSVTIIDNIASEQNCRAVAAAMRADRGRYIYGTRCIAVRKQR